MVPPGDTDALHAAIERLCHDSELRVQMALAARQRAESLRWENYSISLAHIYRALGDYSRSHDPATLDALAATTF